MEPFQNLIQTQIKSILIQIGLDLYVSYGMHSIIKLEDHTFFQYCFIEDEIWLMEMKSIPILLSNIERMW